MADNRTYTLKHPFEHEGVQLTELPWREPRGGEMRRMYNIDTGAGNRLSFLMTECAEAEEDLLDALHAEDWAGFSAELAAFLPSQDS